MRASADAQRKEAPCCTVPRSLNVTWCCEELPNGRQSRQAARTFLASSNLSGLLRWTQLLYVVCIPARHPKPRPKTNMKLHNSPQPTARSLERMGHNWCWIRARMCVHSSWVTVASVDRFCVSQGPALRFGVLHAPGLCRHHRMAVFHCSTHLHRSNRRCIRKRLSSWTKKAAHCSAASCPSCPC